MRLRLCATVLASFGLATSLSRSLKTCGREVQLGGFVGFSHGRVARRATELDLDLMWTPEASGLSRYKGTGFDPEACGEACEALAEAVAKGNQLQAGDHR